MKKPNYAIGKKGDDAPNEKETSTNTFHKEIPDDGRRDKNDRRADPSNPNKVLTVGFGFGSEKGTYEHQVVHRQNTFYTDQYNPRSPHITKGVAD